MRNNKHTSDLILTITPNIVRGRRLGYSDDETTQLAQETFEKMTAIYEDSEGMDVVFEEEMNGREFPRAICPRCGQRNLYLKQKFCDKCGVSICW